MAKFSMQDFVMDTLRRMISGDETDYRVMQYAAGWYERGPLADADMVEVQTLIEERDRKAAEDTAAEAERVRLEALNAKYAAWEITEEGLGAHTVAELAGYMADWGIAATDCNLKADFVAAILAQDAVQRVADVEH